MKTIKLILGLMLLTIFISCTKDSSEENSNITVDEAFVNSKIDIANDDISKITEDQITPLEGVSGRFSAQMNYFLPDCATVTRVPATNNQITEGTTITKTIDFGTTGCQLPNGNTLKGKIILTTVYHPQGTSHVVNCTFENFYHNGRKITGTKTFTRTMSDTTASSSSHPIWMMEMNITITLIDGRVLNRVGTRTSEITMGYNTPLIWEDNVFSVTGNWTTTFPNTSILTSTITNPIIVKLSCLPTNSALSQGVISFEKNTHTATLDYGNGDCDNVALFTINGISYPILLSI